MKSEIILGAKKPVPEEEQEIEVVLDSELDKLPLRYREVIALRYLEGRSLEETSSIAGFPVNTVNSFPYRGLKRLKKQLSKVAGISSIAALDAVLVSFNKLSVPQELTRIS